MTDLQYLIITDKGKDPNKKEDKTMSKYTEMGYAEFMSAVNDYINSLEDGITNGDGENLAAEEWKAWIEKEAADKGEEFTAENIGWIVERLEEDGYVKPSVWYAVQQTSEDDWGTGSYDYDEAVQMLKDQGHGLIAVIDEGNDPSEAVCIDQIEYEDI